MKYHYQLLGTSWLACAYVVAHLGGVWWPPAAFGALCMVLAAAFGHLERRPRGAADVGRDVQWPRR